MASDKYLNLAGLTEVANKVNEKLKTVTSMPASPITNDVVLYKGNSSGDFTKGRIYLYTQIGTYYGWRNGANNYYTLAVNPLIGDTVYSDTLGTDSGYTVEAVDSSNGTITVNSVIYNRYADEDTPKYDWVCQSSNTSVTVQGTSIIFEV